MSVKIYDRAQNKWVIFPGTMGAPGKDAYILAQENGYTGTKEEYIKVLTDIPKIINSIEDIPTKDSKNLVTSGGVWSALNQLQNQINDKTIDWAKITNKPQTYPPSAHTHTLSQITDAGALAAKNKVDKTDLNFDISDNNIVVDSTLSTTSSNPVENKVITNALSNYYTKNQVDSMISSAGGGNVIVNGSLTENEVILGVGSTSIKSSGITLDDLATKEWVNNLGLSSSSWRPITVGNVTLNDHSTPLTITNGTGIELTFNEGTLTITNSATGSGGDGSGYILPSATSTVLGGIKIGHTAINNSELPLLLSTSNQAYINLTVESISSILGYTPANSTDIPNIPIALPNPSSLTVKANDVDYSYTGIKAVNINLDNIYSKKLKTVTTPGAPGIFIGQAGMNYSIDQILVTEDEPNAIIIVPSSVTVQFTGYQKMADLDTLSGGAYKCYCINYINSSITLVNGAIYG